MAIYQYVAASQYAVSTFDGAMEWSAAMADDLDAAITINFGEATMIDFGAAMEWGVVVAIILYASMSINFSAAMK